MVKSDIIWSVVLDLIRISQNLLKFAHKTKIGQEKLKNFVSFSVSSATNHGYRRRLRSTNNWSREHIFTQNVRKFHDWRSNDSAGIISTRTTPPPPEIFCPDPCFCLRPRGSNLRFSLTSARFFRRFGFKNFKEPPQKSGQAHMGRYESNKFTFCTKLSDLCSSPNFKIDFWGLQTS